MEVYRCFQCGKEISGKSILPIFCKHAHATLEYPSKKLFCCETCYQDYLKERQVGEYNGVPIYEKIINGKKYYVPYIECTYGFESIEDCKKRMSMSSVSVIDSNAIKLHNKMMFED